MDPIKRIDRDIGKVQEGINLIATKSCGEDWKLQSAEMMLKGIPYAFFMSKNALKDPAAAQKKAEQDVSEFLEIPRVADILETQIETLSKEPKVPGQDRALAAFEGWKNKVANLVCSKV